ncbi:hypothetical protein DQX05_22360 [Paenibacillus thiaminolyticus]|uniref:Uncharacterized protein n=1 Tax=Paenibacillus thiaminolyticus TaxID=49283 RepID=A0A3A3GC96_PANTH|nr:hypothetical protein DQX05_22360 [Paenibacillus thiaminolyticus]
MDWLDCFAFHSDRSAGRLFRHARGEHAFDLTGPMCMKVSNRAVQVRLKPTGLIIPSIQEASWLSGWLQIILWNWRVNREE